MLTGWSKSKTVTVQAAYITGSLTNFPLTVIITDDADIGASALANGFDLRFTLTDDTVLSCYRKSFLITGGLANAIYDVLAPSLTSGVNGELLCQYGNASAPDVSDSAAVFGSAGAGFAGAWGFGDGVTLDLTDLSGNGNNGTNVGATAAAGVVVGAADFNGTTAYINVGNLSVVDEITLSSWVYPRNIGGGYQFLITKREGQSQNYGLDKLTGAGELRFSFYSSGWRTWTTTNFGLVNDTWQHLALVYDAVVHPKFYRNGILKANDSGGSILPLPINAAPTYFSSFYAGGDYYFNGLIDEPRISSVARSAPWISLDYNQVANQSSVVLWGAEQSAARPWLASFLRRKRMAA